MGELESLNNMPFGKAFGVIITVFLIILPPYPVPI